MYHSCSFIVSTSSSLARVGWLFVVLLLCFILCFVLCFVGPLLCRVVGVGRLWSPSIVRSHPTPVCRFLHFLVIVCHWPFNWQLPPEARVFFVFVFFCLSVFLCVLFLWCFLFFLLIVRHWPFNWHQLLPAARLKAPKRNIFISSFPPSWFFPPSWSIASSNSCLLPFHPFPFQGAIPLTRVAGLDRLSAGANMAMKPFVKRVFTIFATNASFLRVISNFRI